jgi:hypothetical protein
MEAWTSKIYNLEELLSLLVQYLTGKRMTLNVKESLKPTPRMKHALERDGDEGSTVFSFLKRL